ncbi:hypothetical protein CRUP_016035, partial [Coryphaenoides rupestris]
MAESRSRQMSVIYNLLEQFRLEHYYKGCLAMGVTDERDLVDSVTAENLDTMGLSQVEKNRFEKLKDHVRRLRARPDPVAVQKTWEEFCLQYTYPHCPEPRYIRDMDPEQNTVEDLMLRICHLENVGNSTGVCLYTVDGMPLTDDPYFNTWSLKDRHITNEDTLYAIFTPKHNLGNTIQGNFEVSVNLTTDTITDLKDKLANESGIPAHALHYHRALFDNDVQPSVPQTTLGQSVFLSTLYCVKAKKTGSDFETVIPYIRKLSGCSPLAQSLYQLICKNLTITKTQKIAIVEGLYMLFRELLPRPGQHTEEKQIEDLDVFEYAAQCWLYLIAMAEVLMDASSSMEEECYGALKMKKMDAVKELFDSFATRTMAYDFHHVIALVRFSSQ